MNAESVKQRTFAIMWDKAKEDADDPNTVPIIEWLECVAWDELFPGHCFTCHMNEHDPCKDHDPLSCPACWDKGKPLEEMKKLDLALDDPAWTHGGSRTDCGGVDCGCPEAAHE